MNQFIYADNAATTKLDPHALEAMRPWLTSEFGNASQPYSLGMKARKAISNAREIIAACINASPDEIYFTSGGSESDNWAIKGFALQNISGSSIITSAIEHHAVLNSCKFVEHFGGKVFYIRPDSYGQISPDNFAKYLPNNITLASIMMGNNEIGCLEPIEELCELTHMHGGLFHTDAVQAIGHIPVDVKKLNIDLLSASAHKFNGPKGIGFLYVKRGTSLIPFINGGLQESGMRAGTENVASIIGMAVALQENCNHLEDNIRYLHSLENKLLSGIKHIPNIDFVSNGGNRKIPGLISLSFKNIDGLALLHGLDLLGISVSTGSACDSARTTISHVLKAIGLTESYAKGTIRISLSKENSEKDVEHIISGLNRLITKFF